MSDFRFLNTEMPFRNDVSGKWDKLSLSTLAGDFLEIIS
jgi:hypothetical protein